MNEIVYSSRSQKICKQKIKSLLSKIDITHMTIVYGILIICDYSAEAKHGMSKVNQFPWEFSDTFEINNSFS